MTVQNDLYEKAGVDIAKGERLVGWLQSNETTGKQHTLGRTLSGIGGFACLFQPDFSSMEEPLLVSGTDGVGTKLLLGLEQKKLSGLGIDLVAMCINDLYTLGALPIFFLDYFATGKLDENDFKQVLSGIKEGLDQAKCLLLGGETAELPGLYTSNHFDLAGFVLGAVDKKKVLGPEKVQVGDRLIALPSSGFHSNGYSLIRSWLAEIEPSDELIDQILSPTKIYSEIPKLLRRLPDDSIHAISNITGGGLSGNVPRVLPDHVQAEINLKTIRTASWMKQFTDRFEKDYLQLESVLNMGVGMVLVCSNSTVNETITACRDLGLDAYDIGEVKERQTAAPCLFTVGGNHA